MNKLSKNINLPLNLNSVKVAEKFKKLLFTILRLAILISIGYIIIYPLLEMIATSLKTREAFYDAARVWIPSSINAKHNYGVAIKAIDYFGGLKSTIINELLAAMIEIMTCAVVAYGFARFKFKFKRFFTTILFLTILIPEAMVIIPRVADYANLDIFGILGLINKLTGVDLRPNIIGTPLAFWLPSLFAIGLRSGILIYIYMQFFKSLPYELEEAAWIDGAGPIKTFVSISLPSSSVVFTTTTVFSVIWHWNDTLLGSMYMGKDFTLAVNLSRIVATLSNIGYNTFSDITTKAITMAACVLFVIPPLIFYMILQRRFIESIDRVGITG